MANTAAALRQEFGISWQSRPEPEMVPGDPLGSICRGAASPKSSAPSPPAALPSLHSILAAATGRDEVCALVDADDAFDPASAAAAGVRLDRLIWIACGHNAEHALKATDLLVQGGGFGLVALDLGDAPPEAARRISLTSWFRLRRAVEHTPTVLVALARQSNAKTCASLQLECRRERVEWSGARPGRLFRGFRIRTTCIERQSGLARLAQEAVSITGKHSVAPGSNACSPVFMATAI